MHRQCRRGAKVMAKITAFEKLSLKRMRELHLYVKEKSGAGFVTYLFTEEDVCFYFI